MRCFVLMLALVCTPAFAQISIESEYEPYTPIVAGCNCIAPKDGAIQTVWRVPPTCKYIQVEDRMHIWAPPGEHKLELTVVTQTFNEITVLVPDPSAPTDFTKAKTQKIKTPKSLAVEKYERVFKVKGSAPTPPAPGPNPPTPGPNPPAPADGLAGEFRKLFQAMPAGTYNKDTAMKIANVYLSIGSQGGDPARSNGWTLQTFTESTKQLLSQNVELVELAKYRDVLQGVAKAQVKLAQDRKITSSDRENLAKLWTETGNALKEAVY